MALCSLRMTVFEAAAVVSCRRIGETKDRVPSGVAISIVHRLEIVDVEEGHSKRLPVASPSSPPHVRAAQAKACARRSCHSSASTCLDNSHQFTRYERMMMYW